MKDLPSVHEDDRFFNFKAACRKLCKEDLIKKET